MTLGILETKSDGDVKSRRPCLAVKLDALVSSLVVARHAVGDIVLRFLRLDRQFHTITHALSQVLAHGACSGERRSAASENAMQSCPKNIGYPEHIGQLSLSREIMVRHSPQSDLPREIAATSH